MNNKIKNMEDCLTMFAGHFGIAASIKSKAPELPLWSLLVSTQLLDIAFFAFSFVGLERIEPLGDGGYAQVKIYAYYSHSLVGALLLSILAASIAWGFWGKNSGIIIGIVTFSHWILDLIVHRPDMPILPGNVGNLPLLGFGLWESVPASILLEFLLIASGSFFYFKYVLRSSPLEQRRKAILAGCAMTLFLFLILVMDTSL